MRRFTGLGDGAGHSPFSIDPMRRCSPIFREQRTDVHAEPDFALSSAGAILSVEDRRFFDHNGLDVVRITSSMLANVRELPLVQGGTTVTQACSPELSDLRRRPSGVVSGADPARRIERAYTKQQILELYLNKIYFGDGLHGIEGCVAAAISTSTPPS